MNKDQKQLSPSEQVRQAVVDQRAARKTSGPLNPLIISDTSLIIPPNTLGASFFQNPDQPLALQIPAWDFYFMGDDTVEIQHARGTGDFFTVETLVWPAPQNPNDFPRPYDLSRNYISLLGEGEHRFRYVVTDFTNQPMYSAELTLRFDLFPPYRTEKPQSFVPLTAAVTDATLAAGGGIVQLSLPAYADWEDGDRVRWYWANSLPEDEMQVAPVGEVAVTTGGMTLGVPEEHVRRIGDGGCNAWYTLLDRAGYESKKSFHIAIGVALGNLPGTLGRPDVNLATAQDGYLIDSADAALGVEVLVTLPAQVKPTDQIIVRWEGADLGWAPVGPGPALHRYPVPLSILETQYHSDPSTPSTGDKPTRVSYELKRGTVPLGDASRDIRVNFEAIGPVDPIPEWPLPINKELPLPDIHSAMSGLINELVELDAGQPAELRFVLFDGVQTGDTFTFYWGTELILGADYTVQATDNQGDVITRSVSWESIRRGGNGTIPVHYRVTRPGVPNPSDSQAQDVIVDAIVEVPEAVEFLGAVNGMVLTCTSFYENPAQPDPREPAARVQVPPLVPAPAVGSIVTVSWRVAAGHNGAGGPIDAVTFDDPVTVTAEQIRDGFVWYVPYGFYIEPIYAISKDGLATVQYSYMSGKPVTSRAASIIVSPRNPAGACDF